MKVKLTLEYAGEEFSGWQRQEGLQTVQGCLESALVILLRGYSKKQHPDQTHSGEAILVTGSGRTDAGVHARGQVASFAWPADLPFDAHRVQASLNALTPRAMTVLKVEEQPDAFDARFSPHIKCYQYRMLLRRTAPAYDRHRVWLVRPDLDLQAMIVAAHKFQGQHDFESFRARDCSGKTTERTMLFSDLTRTTAEEVTFTIYGKGFLKQMIRIMVGTLVEIGSGRKPPTYIDELFKLRDRSKAGPTAPPDGLTLQWVKYLDTSPVDLQSQE